MENRKANDDVLQMIAANNLLILGLVETLLLKKVFTADELTQVWDVLGLGAARAENSQITNAMLEDAIAKVRTLGLPET